MSYSLIKKFLFQLDPETAHQLALNSLALTYKLGLNKLLFPHPPSTPRSLMGLSFPNPIGLAAGLDKNGDYIDALASLGFGFIEIGTVTPKPQEGNPRPRLFRLIEEEALINRLGFNNKGVDYFVHQVQKARFKGILGVNIGKNRDTPIEKAIDDYLLCFRRVAPYASYVTLNISSPNTPELRNLQQGDLLSALLSTLKKEQRLSKKYVPLVVKIAPDLAKDELTTLAEILLSEKIDGVIATNTTLRRDLIKASPQALESGGLSGKPLAALSTEIVRSLATLFQNKIPIIAAGGVMSEEDVLDKITAGAALVQVYTGFIDQGPWWLNKLIRTAL